MRNLTPVVAAGALLVLVTFTSVRAQTGCDLGFLPGNASVPTPTPNINGVLAPGEWDNAYTLRSSNCVSALPDAPAGSTDIMQIDTSLPAHEIVIRTARDNANMFIALDVNDASIPASPASGGLGDRVVIVLNPNNSMGETFPQTNDFRLDLTTFRGAPASDTKTWYQGSGTGVGSAWIAQGSLPAGVEIVRANRPPGAPGYIVEVKIPFAAIGYVLGATPEAIRDIGIAIAVVNDLGFQQEIISGEGPTTVTSGASFPDTAALHLTNASNVIETADPGSGEWKKPLNWGTGFFTGAGQAVFFDRTPYWWSSRDIKVGFVTASVTAANFDLFPNSTGNPLWYRYKNIGTPCTMRVWARINRNAGVGEIKRRVLFLWAEHGANPQKWHFVHLTGPVTLTPGMTTAITVGKEWASNLIPPNKPNHPCLRAFILPENDQPGFGLAFFQGIGSEAGDNANKITDLMNAYGLAEHSVAQMNISVEPDLTFTCPNVPVPCVPPCVAQGGAPEGDSAPRVLKASFDLSAPRPATEPPAPPQTAPNDKKDVVLDVEVYGVITGTGRNYSFLEHLGGVEEVFSAARLQQQGQVAVVFNVSNSADAPRRIFIVPHLRLPPGVAGVTVQIPPQAGVFAPGETRPVTGVVVAKPTIVQPTGFKRWGLSLHAGANFPHGSFNNIYNSGFSFNVDLEYRISQYFSVEGLYGFHRFGGERFGTFTVPALNLHQFSVDGKAYLTNNAVRPFVNFGVGAYKADPGSTHPGVNAGGGLQFNVTPTFAVEGAYNFHDVFTFGGDTKFSTLQAGVRFRF